MGMLFEGIGTTAYDNAKKMFLYSWIDIWYGMLYWKGWDEANKTINYTGKIVDPVSGKDIPSGKNGVCRRQYGANGNVYHPERAGI